MTSLGSEEPAVDDREALELLRGGDVNGLKQLVERYQTKAVRTATLITRDTAQAEDVVQSAFLRVVDRIDQYDLDRPFEPWFLTIVSNMALKHVSRGTNPISLDELNNPGAASLLETLVAPGLEPEPAMERKELERQVEGLLDDLSPAQRRLIVLRYYLGLSEAEMAEVTGRARGTVKWHLHHARRRLRGLYRLLGGAADG